MKNQRKLAESVIRGFHKSHFLNSRPEASPQVLLDDIASLGKQSGPSKNGCFVFQDGRSRFNLDFSAAFSSGKVFWSSFLGDICEGAIDSNVAIMNLVESLDNDFVKFLEIVLFCLYHLARSRNVTDAVVAVASAVAHATDAPATVIFGQATLLLSSLAFIRLER